MYSPSKFARRIGNIGRPLPSPFPVFEAERTIFRYGATSMIAGQPGSFKSVLALNMAIYWARQGLTVLYFSADSDEYTVIKRISAMLTGVPEPEVEDDIIQGKIRRYTRELSKTLGSVEFAYSDMDMEGIARTCQTFEAVYGDYPSVIFIDNLMDYVPGEGEWELMRNMTRELDVLARQTKAHVCILHHVSEANARPDQPPARKEIQGKITQKPRLVLTVSAVGTFLKVACVKNTNGPQDPTGKSWSPFTVTPSLQVVYSQYTPDNSVSELDSYE